MTRADFADSVMMRLQRGRQRTPDREALIQGDRRWSYAELDAVTGRLAQALRDDGVRPGDRIALLIGNSWAFVLAYLASLKAGGVVVPVNPGTPLEALAPLLHDCSPAAALVEPRHRPLLAPLSTKVAGLRRGIRRWHR
jgi:acyl-CoA synthetase (AMP-forming)/AMP-acid ligase II